MGFGGFSSFGVEGVGFAWLGVGFGVLRGLGIVVQTYV